MRKKNKVEDSKISIFKVFICIISLAYHIRDISA